MVNTHSGKGNISEMESTQVTIVGAGPSGLVMGIALAKLNISVSYCHAL